MQESFSTHSRSWTPDVNGIHFVDTANSPDLLSLQVQSPYTNVGSRTGWLAPITDSRGNPRGISSSYTAPLGAFTS